MTNRNRRNEYDVLITNCTKQGSVRLENLKNINNKKDNIVSIFFYKALQSQLASDVEVSNLKLDVNDHNFSFVSKVKASMSAKIKMSGKVWFLSGERVLKIRLDKAKASIISIKDKIFKELEASNDPNIRVERPNIYITLEK